MFDGVGLNSQADPEPVKTEVQVTDDGCVNTNLRRQRNVTAERKHSHTYMLELKERQFAGCARVICTCSKLHNTRAILLYGRRVTFRNSLFSRPEPLLARVGWRFLATVLAFTIFTVSRYYPPFCHV